MQLLIRDGSPYWYPSPGIWVVPGSNPSGAPGSPMAGQPAHRWGRVSNSGTMAIDANGVRVDFYWADPMVPCPRTAQGTITVV